MSTVITLSINDIQIDQMLIIGFEWKAKINSGYSVYAEIVDPYFKLFDQIFKSDNFRYLEDARQRPVRIKWILELKSDSGSGKKKTEERLAFLTGLKISGNNNDARFYFYAQDPPSFLLSAGVGDGRVYKGKIGGKDGVISQCIKDFGTISEMTSEGLLITKVVSDVSETSDSKYGIWPMFRMDPMNYIVSLLEWSSSLTDDTKKSRWMIACNDDKINIKKAKDLIGKNFGVFSITDQTSVKNDIFNWDIDLNNFLTQYQTKLVTAGVSATTGKIIIGQIDDESTKSKVTPFTKENEGKDRAPTKPKRGDDWPEGLPATFIRAIPEHSGGEVHKSYEEYADGRARQIYEDMLSNVMRMTICVPGFAELDSSDLLGVSTCSINWPRYDGSDPWLAHGPWIIDGFHHFYRIKSNDWLTYIDLYRIDWDSKAVPLDPPPIS